MKTTQFKLILPADVKAWLEEEAVRNLRSQGAQVVTCLRAAMSRQETMREGQRNEPEPNPTDSDAGTGAFVWVQ